MRPVLLTGASGALGRALVPALAAEGWTLRLTDIAPFPDPLPTGARFQRGDLNDGVALLHQAEGVGAIIHLGGVSTDQPFEDVFGPNLRGVHHVYEAARREGARVIFASSNHAFGFQERGAETNAPAAFRPDSFYGLSKVYGELMGRLYWDKHGVESVNLRIGSCFPRPINRRMLSTWLSYGDLTRLMIAAVTAPRSGHAVIWACSANPASFWGEDHRERIGWAPLDTAEAFRAELEGAVSGDPVEERYQGGGYCTARYSRPGPSPRDPFALD